jgi:hypothetical protein
MSRHYVTSLVPNLVNDCQQLVPSHFIFQQDGTPAHTAALAQNWLEQNCVEFINKDEWPPNSPDIYPLDYQVWGAMLKMYQYYTPTPMNTDELKNVLQAIWTVLPQEPVNKAVLAFRKRLRSCIEADGRHFKHVM